MVPDWRIYYTDNQTYSSLDGPVGDAPREGFLCAIGYDETGKRYIMHGWDWYRWSATANQFWGGDTAGIIDWARRKGFVTGITAGNPSIIHTVQGDFDTVGFFEKLKQRKELFEARTCSRSEWQQTIIAANNDTDFPIGGRDP